ncbi:hypothetical protein [Actinomadura geliboluensis]|uniref:hypothetical protein n=1 Tax=Actinomadura geliboluensis TaxID=882440 RepID=UPI0036A0B52F
MARLPAGSRPARITLAVTAAIVVPAGAVLTTGGALQADAGGRFGTAEHRFTTPTAALKTDEIDVRADTARPADPEPDAGELAQVRIVVRPADPRTRLFVGIGPKQEVDAYLRTVAHDEFASAGLSPFRAAFTRHPGAARAASAPAHQPFWVAASSGAGVRTLNWNKTHGTWSVTVMRLDGYPGLDVHASVGLRFAFLFPSGLTLLAAGALMLLYIPLSRRTPHRPPPSAPTANAPATPARPRHDTHDNL